MAPEGLVDALIERPRASVPARLTGSPLRWGRDLGIVGAATGFSVPLAGLGVAPDTFGWTAAGIGLVAGLLLGLEMPEFLESARRRVPLAAIGFRCVLAGAGIGAGVGIVAAHATGHLILVPFVVAGLAGALQLGWLWLPYTVLTVLERRTWPVVALACAAAPAIGWLSAALCRLALHVLFSG